jgi:two-component system cell cycle sensor histidine kinase/response regulator CckA
MVFMVLLALAEGLENLLLPHTHPMRLGIGLLCSLIIGLATLPLLNRGLARPLRRQQQRIREQKAELEMILRGTGVGTWDWQVQTGRVKFNERWAEIIGYRLEDLGETSISSWTQLVLPEDLEHSNRMLEQVFSRLKDEYCCEARMRHRDGSIVWVLDQGRVVEWSPEGKPLRMMGTHLDITARKLQEERVATVNRELEQDRQVFLAGPAVAFTWRNQPGWPVEYVSPNVEAVLGYPVADLLEGRVNYADCVHPDDLARVAGEVTRAAQCQALAFDHEPYRIRHRDGRWLWLADHTVVIRDEDGTVTHFRGYVLDITERKLVEQSRLELERQVQHAQHMESLGVLAGGVAHDFNNILMTILGNAELAQDEVEPDSELARDLLDIENAARQAASLAGKMLAYSGRGHYEIGPVALNEVIRDTLPLIRSGSGSHLHIRCELDPDLPDLTGDRTQLCQVVINLITNAGESLETPDGEVRVRTALVQCTRRQLENSVIGRSAIREYELEPGPWLLLEVLDTGSGMDEAVLARLFEPFFTTRFVGRGLGMAAVLGIVRGHRGTLTVDSTPGRGTTVRVLLPVSGVARLKNPALPCPACEGESRPLRVLLVDDEEAVRRMAQRMLERCGCVVQVAEEGTRALALVEEAGEPYDLVILDLSMPGMSGEEVLARLHGIHAHQPVLMCSGHDWQPPAELRANGNGARVGFLQKPYTTAGLRQAIVDLRIEAVAAV